MLTIHKKKFKKKDKEKDYASSNLDKQWTELTPRKGFRCGSVDDLITKCPKPTNNNKKRRKKSLFNEKSDCASKKNPRMVIMILTKIYMNLSHECLVMTKFLVEILVTVCN